MRHNTNTPRSRVAKVWLDRVGAQVGVDGDDIGAVAIERLDRILLGGRPDVTTLGIEDQQHDLGIRVVDVRAQPLELWFGALRGEVGELRFERAHGVGGRVDDCRAELEHRVVGRVRTPTGMRCGSGSSPTHSIDCDVFHAVRNLEWKPMRYRI